MKEMQFSKHSLSPALPLRIPFLCAFSSEGCATQSFPVPAACDCVQDGRNGKVEAVVKQWSKRLGGAARRFEHWQHPRKPPPGYPAQQARAGDAVAIQCNFKSTTCHVHHHLLCKTAFLYGRTSREGSGITSPCVSLHCSVIQLAIRHPVQSSCDKLHLRNHVQLQAVRHVT